MHAFHAFCVELHGSQQQELDLTTKEMENGKKMERLEQTFFSHSYIFLRTHCKLGLRQVLLLDKSVPSVLRKKMKKDVKI